MKCILHILNGSITSDNGYSQRIKRQLELWSELEEFNISIANFLDWRNLNPKKLAKDIKSSKLYISKLGFNYFFRMSLPLIAFFYNPDMYFNISAISLKNLIKKENIQLIYAENLVCSYIAYKIKERYNIDYIIDYHGVAPEEFDKVGRTFGNVNYKYYKKMEKLALENAKRIVCVSEEFKDYIVDNFNVVEENIFVVPSCIQSGTINFDSKKRETMRDKLNIKDKKVIIYAGGIGLWHCDDEMIYLFKSILEIDKNYYFIFLTHDRNINIIEEKMRIYNIEKDKYIINSVNHKEIYSYYMAADIGLIIRDNSLINKISSPTKIPEYLSTGLILITTDSIGDVKRIPSDKVIIKYEDLVNKNIDIEKLCKSLNNSRKREENYEICRAYLKEKYVWDSMSNVYKKLFS